MASIKVQRHELDADMLWRELVESSKPKCTYFGNQSNLLGLCHIKQHFTMLSRLHFCVFKAQKPTFLYKADHRWIHIWMYQLSSTKFQSMCRYPNLTKDF